MKIDLNDEEIQFLLESLDWEGDDCSDLEEEAVRLAAIITQKLKGIDKQIARAIALKTKILELHEEIERAKLRKAISE